MTTHTTVNTDLLIAKLLIEVERSATFATVKTTLLQMAIRAIEQQQAELEAMRPIAIPILDVTITNMEAST